MPVVFQSPPNNPNGWEDDFFQSALNEVVPPGSTATREKAAEEYQALINELKDDAKRRTGSRIIGPAKQDALKLAGKCEALALDFRTNSAPFEVGAATFNPRDTNPTDQETEGFIALVARYAHQLDEMAATLRARAGRYPPKVDAMSLHDIRFGAVAQVIATKSKFFFRRYNPDRLSTTEGGPFQRFVWITYQLVYGRLSGETGEEPGAKFLSAIRQVLKEPPSTK